MSKYGTKDVVVQEGTIRKTIKAPGAHVVRIHPIELKENTNGNSYLKFTFETPPVEGLERDDGFKGQTATDIRYMSEKAFPYTQEMLVSWANALDLKDDLDKHTSKATNDEEFVQAVNKVLADQKVAMIFKGEETEYTPEGGDTIRFVAAKIPNWRGGYMDTPDNLDKLQAKVDKDEEKGWKSLLETLDDGEEGEDTPPFDTNSDSEEEFGWNS